jgi:peptide/nickel transport system permease protein
MSVRPQDVREKSWLARAADSDLWYSFIRSPVTVVSAAMTLIFFLAALLAGVVAPHDPFDLASISIMDASLPPAWLEGGDHASCWAPTTRAATSFRPSSTARAFR